MLAGQPPFTGPTAESLTHQHLNVPPRQVTDLRPTVPSPLASAIQRALAKAAADRFSTASEFAAALAAGAESKTPTPVPAAAVPVTAAPVTAAPATSAPRRRLAVAAGSAAAIILVALAAWRFGPSLFPGPAPDPAKKAWILVAGPAALQGEATRSTVMQSAPLVRWLVAEAYERLDRPDSAAAYFERATAPVPEGGTDFTHIRMASSFGHRRLALLYTRLGRREDARRHWEIFSTTFTHPDPEMKLLVEEARAALASAEGIARTARR
jgi:hypothetical protein